MGRESYWAANRVPNTNLVRVIYLLGYYFDLGVQEGYTSCKLSSIAELASDCDGHHGDSEHVVSTLAYNSTTKHWVAQRLGLSHHNGYITATPGPKGYPSGFAWSRLGASPIIWVANGKHANYPSQQACNDGNGGGYLVDLVFSYDTCNGNDSFFYLDNWANRNIGSSQVHLINCVLSQNQFYQDPPHPEECFWTADRFTGWQLDQTTSAQGYRTPLQTFGY